MNWSERYAANFMAGRDLGERANDIEESIDRILRTPATAREMEVAVDTLAEKMARAGGKVYPPSGTEIAGVIIGMRKGHRDDINGTSMGHAIIVLRDVRLPTGEIRQAFVTVTETERDWQPALMRATPAKRWELICAPSKDPDCMARESYCDQHGLKYVRFTPPAKIGVALAGRAVVGCGQMEGRP